MRISKNRTNSAAKTTSSVTRMGQRSTSQACSWNRLRHPTMAATTARTNTAVHTRSGVCGIGVSDDTIQASQLVIKRPATRATDHPRSGRLGNAQAVSGNAINPNNSRTTYHHTTPNQGWLLTTLSGSKRLDHVPFSRCCSLRPSESRISSGGGGSSPPRPSTEPIRLKPGSMDANPPSSLGHCQSRAAVYGRSCS